ncbi:restriction endonuclease subunit S (plasmid) [Polymorphobacter sp. PAMC 29334]|uniref:restriction endonuclease subunit S n=1 Tax=Polymorphobacter sp. PAMC 29334 TaxID=2862331 RepID=UPI001C790875|nr:restriction endonuclease subunit S [Polymorphobacter sp. PAMC 29334]QYE37230.1 restriction endonuclease subunit S [Polymorphobacter sp. PAMC 29334]
MAAAAAAEPVEGPWPLPDGWQWVRLGHLGEFLNGAAFKPTDWDGEGMPIIRIQNLINPSKSMNRTTRVVDERLRVKEGDILVSWSATLDAFVWKREDAWLNQHIFRVLPDEAFVDRDYLFFLLKNEIETLRKGEHLHGSTMMHINRGPFLAHPVPLPPRETQRKVAARIDELFTELDDGEAALARAKAELGLWRQALLKAAVTGELTADWRAANPPAETGADLLHRILADRRKHWASATRNRKKQYSEPIGPLDKIGTELPAGWVQATVEQVAFVENGQTPKGIEALIMDAGEIPWFKVSSMNLAENQDRLQTSQWWLSRSNADALGLRIHPAGSIVFPKRGGSIFTEKKRRLARGGAVDLNVMAVVPLAETAEHLWTFFQNLSLRGISDGSNVPQINYDDVAQLVVLFPSVSEAVEIARRVDRALAATSATEVDINEFAAGSAVLRQSILAAAFRGDLVA